MRDELIDVVKDPLTRLVIQHDAHLKVLDTYIKIGIGVGTAGLSILVGILGALLMGHV